MASAELNATLLAWPPDHEVVDDTASVLDVLLIVLQGGGTVLVNYTPLAIVLPLIFGLWYLISAKDRYQGPVRTLEEEEITAGVWTRCSAG